MKRTSEQMQSVINEWRESGLTKTVFCEQRNITSHIFHYWCKRLIPASGTGFAEVKVVAHRRTDGCEIIFPSGTRIVVQGEPSASWLRELVR